MPWRRDETEDEEAGMRKRLAVTTALAACVALIVGALPALTADRGTVVATVNVADATPCITLDRSTVSFGTLQLADPAATATPVNDADNPVRVGSCASAAEDVQLSVGQVTTTSGGTWRASGLSPANTCADGQNFWQPYYATSRFGSGRLYEFGTPGAPDVRLTALAAGDAENLTLRLKMPCRGSAGAGETASFTLFLLAVIP
jgi:hypothetical protein